jgi:hypothetical protein
VIGMTTGSLAFLIAFAVMIQIAALMLLGLGRQWIRFRGLDQEAAAIPPVPAMALQAGAMPSAGPSTSGWGGFRDFILNPAVGTAKAPRTPRETSCWNQLDTHPIQVLHGSATP